MAPLLDRYYDNTRRNLPLVYYRMREGSGTTMTDSSANANNGTYNGSGINWVAIAGLLQNGYAATAGKSVPIFNSHITTIDWTTIPITVTNPFVAYLDGAAGRATATLSSPAINTSAASVVTVEMWVNWDGVLSGSNGTFEALANFAGATGLLLGFLKVGAADYRFGLSVRNTGDLWGLSNANTLAALTKDIYHHVVYTIVNNAVQTSKLYIDGVQQTMTQQVGTSTTTKSVTSAFALGYDGTASFYNGSISEVAVYNGEPYNATAVKNRFHQGAYGAEYREPFTVPGIESRIEVQQWGFVLNDKSNRLPGNRSRTLDDIFVDDIGGLDGSDIRFSEESNFFRDGMNPLITRYGGRTLTFGGYIEGANFNSLRQLQSKLKFHTTGQPVTATGLAEIPVVFRNIWNNGYDTIVYARKSVPLQMAENQQGAVPRRRFLLTMRSSWPHLESTGARTDVITMGATIAIPNKGNVFSYPSLIFYGPFYSAELRITSPFHTTTTILAGTLSASSIVTMDSKTRACSAWTFMGTSDFPMIAPATGDVSDLQYVTYANFVSVSGGTAGVTRVEITWKHTIN